MELSNPQEKVSIAQPEASRAWGDLIDFLKALGLFKDEKELSIEEIQEFLDNLSVSEYQKYMELEQAAFK